MIKSTLIYRDDGLPLCSSVDDDSDGSLMEQKKRVKLVVSRMTPNSANEATLESGRYEINYIRKDVVIYVVICEAGYPRNLAFSYLNDVCEEFQHSYSHEYTKPNIGPYAFVSFDNFLQKTKRAYSDKKVQDNLDQLNQELVGVKQIMSKNIEDLLYRGDSLDKMSDMSASLKESSKKYRKSAQKINFDLLISQYAPIAMVAFFFVFLVWWVFLR
ncbi:SNAP receptor [Maudiozyma humilis]|uniref:Protein transport protein SEC22 n=1 Tax=Maudiozyma humilis TaxID=51915 RepID=A0AAV5RVW2_MAUHU|nr:SNAP receptor [Kazachstania humilis]